MSSSFDLALRQADLLQTVERQNKASSAVFDLYGSGREQGLSDVGHLRLHVDLKARHESVDREAPSATQLGACRLAVVDEQDHASRRGFGSPVVRVATGRKRGRFPSGHVEGSSREARLSLDLRELDPQAARAGTDAGVSECSREKTFVAGEDGAEELESESLPSAHDDFRGRPLEFGFGASTGIALPSENAPAHHVHDGLGPAGRSHGRKRLAGFRVHERRSRREFERAQKLAIIVDLRDVLVHHHDQCDVVVARHHRAFLLRLKRSAESNAKSVVVDAAHRHEAVDLPAEHGLECVAILGDTAGGPPAAD